MNKTKHILLYLLFLLLMTGCSSKITEGYLIEGHWTLQAGYDNGERVEKPSCIPLQDGLEFKDDGIVFVELFDRDFEYRLSEKDSTILFRDTGPNLHPKATPDRGIDYFHYDVKVLNDDEMVLEGLGLLEGFNCNMVRK